MLAATALALGRRVDVRNGAPSMWALEDMREDAAEQVTKVAELIRRRNAIDGELATIIGRPPSIGHLGEWLAAHLFDIQLNVSASMKATDGIFTTGPLSGKTVNVKWYAKREGLIDLTRDPTLDYYLVFSGPRSAAMTSVGGVRPLLLDAVYLFDARSLLAEQEARGVAVGIASSVRNAQWDAAEIYPEARNGALTPSNQAIELLRLLASP